MDDPWGLNLELRDFDRLLRKEVLVEEPVDITVFVGDQRFLGMPPLSEIQEEIARHITQVLRAPTLIQLHGEEKGLEIYEKYTVNEVIALLGKGAGKDHVSRICFAYIVYLMHCLRDPLEYYGKAHGIYIDLLNLAVNAQQAQRVFFEPFKNLLLNSPFFTEVGFEPRVSELFFFSRPVRCFSGHSEAEGWEGYELMAVVLDEVAAFRGLGPNVPVLTPNGWVKNGSLKVGDNVIGKDGNPTRIIGVFPMGSKEVFEIEFGDGVKAQCSEDHIWNVYEYSDEGIKANRNLQLKDFKSLTLKGKYNHNRYSIPVVEPVNFRANGDLPIDPYIMGILISGGGLTDGIKFSTQDSFVVDEIQKRLPENLQVVHYQDYDYGISRKIWSGKNQVLDSVRDFSLNLRSDLKFIPDIYLYASIEDRKALLAGLMDGDGATDRGRESYSTTSDRLKDGIIELCRGLGGVPSVTKYKGWWRSPVSRPLGSSNLFEGFYSN